MVCFLTVCSKRTDPTDQFYIFLFLAHQNKFLNIKTTMVIFLKKSVLVSSPHGSEADKIKRLTWGSK